MRKLIVDDSSNVLSITHSEDHLDVEFTSGSRYRYGRCTIDDFATACHSPSVGRWVQVALVRCGDKHPVERLPVASATVPTVDQYRVALQVIASMRSPDGVESAPADVARAALEGRPAPSPSPDWPKPIAVKGRVFPAGLENLVASPMESMTPDEAEGFAHELLVAALQARS